MCKLPNQMRVWEEGWKGLSQRHKVWSTCQTWWGRPQMVITTKIAITPIRIEICEREGSTTNARSQACIKHHMAEEEEEWETNGKHDKERSMCLLVQSSQAWPLHFRLHGNSPILSTCTASKRNLAFKNKRNKKP